MAAASWNNVAIYRELATRSFWGLFGLVFGRVWKCILAAAFPQLGVSVSMAWPLLWLNGADDGLRYRHVRLPFEPAVSSVCCSGRFPFRNVPYIIAQVTGGLLQRVLYVVASERQARLEPEVRVERLRRTFAWWYSLIACFVAEVVLTFFFLMIIMGATDKACTSRFAPIAIGWD